MLKRINYKLIFYILIRVFILVVPLFGLFLLMEYTVPDPTSKKGYVDRGLGYGMIGGLWIVVFCFLILVEMVYRMYLKQKVWCINGIILLLFALLVLFFI